MKGQIKAIAFITYPVTDMPRSRAFYEAFLGLQVTANWDDAWVEYDIGDSTLAITNTFPHLKPGASGCVMALEVADFDEVLASLKSSGTELFTGPFDTPACRGCSIKDPDGNEVILHARKEASD